MTRFENVWSAAALSVVVIGLVASPGCRGPAAGAFTAHDFVVREDHYRVLTVPDGSAASGRLFSSGWVVDNYRLGPDGPVEPKRSLGSTRSVAIDVDGDGRTDRRASVPVVDVELVQERDGTHLWVQTTPVSASLGQRDLDVIAHDYVDRVGSGSYVTIDWGAAAVRERHVGTVIREEGPVTVDGVPGYWVTFEIVSVDQRAVDTTHQGDLVTVVLVRPQARWTGESRFVRGSAGVPMLVTAAYASRAEFHAAHRAEFESFLRRIDFHDAQ